MKKRRKGEKKVEDGKGRERGDSLPSSSHLPGSAPVHYVFCVGACLELRGKLLSNIVLFSLCWYRLMRWFYYNTLINLRNLYPLTDKHTVFLVLHVMWCYFCIFLSHVCRLYYWLYVCVCCYSLSNKHIIIFYYRLLRHTGSTQNTYTKC